MYSTRIIYSANGVLTDVSASLGEYLSGSAVLPVVAATDAIYIGADLPFNNRYIEVETANTLASAMSVAYWDGRQFTAAVETLDQTSDAGASLGVSGNLSFVPNKNWVWKRDDTVNSTGQEIVLGLGNITVYDLYWAKITFSADLDLTTALKYIGYKFATDADLAFQYPDLVRADVMGQFQTGKTNWNEQLILCTELVITDLKNRGVIISENQLLEPKKFTQATVYRLAEMIYSAFGNDFEKNRIQAREYYKRALDLALAGVDGNADATLDPYEKQFTQGYLTR